MKYCTCNFQYIAEGITKFCLKKYYFAAELSIVEYQ